MFMDGAKEVTQFTWGKRIKNNQAKKKIAEPHSQFKNIPKLWFKK